MIPAWIHVSRRSTSPGTSSCGSTWGARAGPRTSKSATSIGGCGTTRSFGRRRSWRRNSSSGRVNRELVQQRSVERLAARIAGIVLGHGAPHVHHNAAGCLGLTAVALTRPAFHERRAVEVHAMPEPPEYPVGAHLWGCSRFRHILEARASTVLVVHAIAAVVVLRAGMPTTTAYRAGRAASICRHG